MFIFRRPMSIEGKREFIKTKSLLVKDGFVIANYNDDIKAFTVVCEKCGDNQVVRESDLGELTCTCECRLERIRQIYDNRITYQEVKERLQKLEEQKQSELKAKEKNLNNRIKEKRERNNLLYKARKERNNTLPKTTNDFDNNFIIPTFKKEEPKYTLRETVINPIEKFIIVDVIAYSMGEIVFGNASFKKNYVICKLVTATGDCDTYYIEESNFKKKNFFRPYITKVKPKGYSEIIRFTAEKDCEFDLPSGYFGLDVSCATYYNGDKELYVLLTHSSIEPEPCKLTDYYLRPKASTKEVIEKTDCRVSRKDIDSKPYIAELYFDKNFCNDYIKHVLKIKKFVFMIK